MPEQCKEGHGSAGFDRRPRVSRRAAPMRRPCSPASRSMPSGSIQNAPIERPQPPRRCSRPCPPNRYSPARLQQWSLAHRCSRPVHREHHDDALHTEENKSNVIPMSRCRWETGVVCAAAADAADVHVQHPRAVSRSALQALHWPAGRSAHSSAVRRACSDDGSGTHQARQWLCGAFGVRVLATHGWAWPGSGGLTRGGNRPTRGSPTRQPTNTGSCPPDPPGHGQPHTWKKTLREKKEMRAMVAGHALAPGQSSGLYGVFCLAGRMETRVRFVLVIDAGQGSRSGRSVIGRRAKRRSTSNQSLTSMTGLCLVKACASQLSARQSRQQRSGLQRREGALPARAGS